MKQKVERAISRLLECDRELLARGVNERTLATRLAQYLEAELPSWRADPEYDRNEQRVKRLRGIREYVSQRRPLRRHESDGIKVVPDIIVHHRGNHNYNLLAVELKKTTSSGDRDFDHLKLACMREELKYVYTLFLELEASDAPSVHAMALIGPQGPVA